MEVFLAWFSTVSLPAVCVIIKDAKCVRECACACAHLRLLPGILMTPLLNQQKNGARRMKDGRVSEQKDGQYVWKLDQKNIKTIKNM